MMSTPGCRMQVPGRVAARNRSFVLMELAMQERAYSTRGCGFVLTPEGRDALLDADVCICAPKLAGLLLQCPDCGTVWGSLRQVDQHSDRGASKEWAR